MPIDQAHHRCIGSIGLRDAIPKNSSECVLCAFEFEDRFMKVRYWILLVFVFGIVACFVLSRPPAADGRLPIPNGLDYYLKAANSLTRPAGKDDLTTTDEMLRYVGGNREALRQLRFGLGFRCEIPAKPMTNAFSSGLTDISSFKLLGQMLRAEGDQALNEGRLRDATKAYLDEIRFGQEISRGVLIYDLVGISIENSACAALTRAKERLSTSDRQFVSEQLSLLSTNREPFSAVAEREKTFMRLIRTGVIQSVMWPYLWYKMRPVLQRTEAKGLQNMARIESLRAEFSDKAIPTKSGE
jgi:hypothetical protein